MSSTLKLRADSAADIERAADILRQGGTVAFPTETVYGLGAHALNRSAIAKIFAAKQRPAWDPLIVHVADEGDVAALVEQEGETERRVRSLARSFWPGPLTLLLPRKATVPDEVTAGRRLVGVRVPAHPAAQALLQATGIPVAAPSANTFGHVSPTTAQHVLSDLDGRIDAVLDGGPTSVGVESTVVDPTQTPVVLYRPGVVTVDQISEALGVKVEVFTGGEATFSPPESLPSPGFGIRHYAPRAHVLLVEGTEHALHAALAQSQQLTGVLLPEGWTAPRGILVERWGTWNDPASLAAHLFAGLRSLDVRGARTIVCPLPPTGSLNDAVRDRLMKAARTP